MRNQAPENLMDLLARFMDARAAEAAYKDIEAGERWLDAYAAPAPATRVLAVIKMQMAASALRRRRTIRLIHGSVATAAAVILLALIGLHDPGVRNRSAVSYASLIPTAIWESDDIAADDLDIVCFTAEIRHLEAQIQALDAGEGETEGGGPEDLENELMAIETEFWKG